VIAPPLVALAVLAAPPPPAVVTLVEPELVTLVPGGTAEARLAFTIADGFKLQANPASDRFLVAAELELEADELIHTGSPVYPPGKPYRLRGASSDLAIYEGSFAVAVPLEAWAGAPEATTSGPEVVLEGVLRYQACNPERCLRPSTIPVRFPVRIAAPAAASQR
jgi:hypothetical protein